MMMVIFYVLNLRATNFSLSPLHTQKCVSCIWRNWKTEEKHETFFFSEKDHPLQPKIQLTTDTHTHTHRIHPSHHHHPLSKRVSNKKKWNLISHPNRNHEIPKLVDESDFADVEEFGEISLATFRSQLALGYGCIYSYSGCIHIQFRTESTKISPFRARVRGSSQTIGSQESRKTTIIPFESEMDYRSSINGFRIYCRFCCVGICSSKSCCNFG